MLSDRNVIFFIEKRKGEEKVNRVVEKKQVTFRTETRKEVILLLLMGHESEIKPVMTSQDRYRSMCPKEKKTCNSER